MYVQMLKALYGMLVSSIFYYKSPERTKKALDLKLVHTVFFF